MGAEVIMFQMADPLVFTKLFSTVMILSMIAALSLCWICGALSAKCKTCGGSGRIRSNHFLLGVTYPCPECGSNSAMALHSFSPAKRAIYACEDKKVDCISAIEA